MTIGDDGIASLCMGKPHVGNPCDQCGHTAEALRECNCGATVKEAGRALTIRPHQSACPKRTFTISIGSPESK